MFGGGVSRGLVLLLAVSCGATVANLYYAQPLLNTSRAPFGLTGHRRAADHDQPDRLRARAGVPGPEGDLQERRGLISVALVVTAAGLVVMAVAPGYAVFAGALAVVGFTATAAQVIVPMSASLAAESERGRVVGTVMSGLLIGILLARTFSGLVAAALGWRVVFWFAAAIMVALAVTLRLRLPRVPPTTDLRYRGVLRSVLSLIAAEPVLRLRMALGFFAFGCFSTLWTSLSFLLSAPPFNYGNGGHRAVRPGRASPAPPPRRAPAGWPTAATAATPPGSPPS